MSSGRIFGHRVRNTSIGPIVNRANRLRSRRWRHPTSLMTSSVPSCFYFRPSADVTDMSPSVPTDVEHAHTTLRPRRCVKHNDETGLTIANTDIFTARCYASAVLAMGLCPSVCHKSEFCRNGWTNRAGFWHVSFLPPVLHCVKRKLVYLHKNKGTSHWNFVLKSGLRKFRHGISMVETCYQLSSRKVDAQSVIDWAVVGQLSR